MARARRIEQRNAAAIAISYKETPFATGSAKENSQPRKGGNMVLDRKGFGPTGHRSVMEVGVT